MKMKKLGAMIAALAVSAISFASVSASAESPESLTVMVAGGWGSYAGTWDTPNADNSITITDNGTYTIHVNSGEAGELAEGSWAMAIRTDGFSVYAYGDEGDDFDTCVSKGNITLTVDSVKINGREIKTGESVLRNDDNGNDLRVNIYNQWTSPKVAIVDGNQTFDGDVEVTFTVGGVFGAAEEETTTAAEETTTAAEETTTAAEETTTAAGTTTTAAGTTTTAKTTAATTTTAAGGTTTTAAAATTNTATGDNSGLALAVAALAVAGAAAMVTRKNK